MSLDRPVLAQEVYHRSFGHGPQAVFAVHCSLAHTGAWRGLAAALGADRVTLQGFDLLSHGKSPDWDGQGILQMRNAEAGLVLLEAQVAAAKGRAVDLLGHSFGATVALAMAQARPDLVRSLTLIEPVLFAAAGGLDPAALAQMRADHERVRAPYAAGDVEQATRLFNRAWGTGHPKWPDLPESARAAMMRSFPAVMDCDGQVYDDEAGLLAPGRLEALTMPVLLLQGAETQPIMASVTRALAARMPTARVAVIDGAGHMVPVTHAAETATLLTDFWAKTGRARAREHSRDQVG
ncbi:alpha/beta fold hydrolase [Phaeobacter sp. B1627]|uniref:alpha/beta fold hydrolase n=1 Tax=Phaeobacter sp. B1627 TaxID=2583809 RepID=UPI00111BA77C|nr:alpha/beta fold hydrolase [Phaeobacter sp. B1627]TNJ48471.1 alpha/beta fold hydrolase [Phaeobacter sp. B1627]